MVGCGVSQWVSRGHGVYGMGGGEWREGEEEMGGVVGGGRALSAGVAIGSAGFVVEAVFGDRRDLFGANRKCGVRPLARDGCRSGVLFTLRDLRGW